MPKTQSKPEKLDTKPVVVNDQPKITSIAINSKGTIYGVLDGVVYIYDEFEHKWSKA